MSNAEMSGDIKLVGHDNPYGKYPSSIVPIVKINNKFYAVYADHDRNHLEVIEDDSFYYLHDPELNEKLSNYNYNTQRLFAYSEKNICTYKIIEESSFFRKVLEDPFFSETDPFMRYSLAKGTRSAHLVGRELTRCLIWLLLQYRLDACVDMNERTFIKEWYEQQVIELRRASNDSPELRSLVIPDNWEKALKSSWYATCFQDSTNPNSYIQIDEFESSMTHLITVLIVSCKPTVPNGPLRECMMRNIAIRRTKYIFLLSTSVNQREIVNLEKGFEQLEEEARVKYSMSELVTEISGKKEQYIHLAQLPYEWNSYPYIFYDTQNDNGERRVLGVRGIDPGVSISNSYVTVPSEYALDLLKTITAKAPIHIELPNIDEVIDNYSLIERNAGETGEKDTIYADIHYDYLGGN